MTNPIKALAAYYKDMNSEPDGRASIKRNIAWWAFFVACFGIESFSLYKLSTMARFDVKEFVWLSFAYVVTNYAFILIILGITSVKELKEAAMGWKYGKNAPDTTNVEQPDTKTDS